MKEFNEHIDNVINIDPTWWNAKTKTFSFYISEAPDVHVTQELWLLNTATKNKVKFDMYNIDTDGEDTFGWRYISECKQFELLIINT